MHRFLSRVALLLSVAVLSATYSCSDDDDVITAPNQEPPTLSVNVSNIQRTQVDFQVTSAGAADYAYVVVEAGQDQDFNPTAEELFTNGTIGQFENGIASVSTLDVEGGKNFVLYIATRRINPYVYSDVKKIDLSTDMPYTDLVTLDRIGTTEFKYHVEFPEGVTSMKHVVVKKTDYEAIKNILAPYGGVTYDSYLKVFGHALTESSDIENDKFVAYGNIDDIHVYTDTEYILMAGVPMDDENIDPDQFQVIEFKTRPAGICPFDIQVSVETTSTTATVSIVPEDGITDYRVLIDKRSEFDYFRREGEAQVRSVVIGNWDDSTNQTPREHVGSTVINSTGLIPNTDYVVGIVGFDSERHEIAKYIDFRTGEPVGPVPQITITAMPESVTAPWKSAAYNVKLQNAVSAVYGFFLKSQVDAKIAQGVDMSTIIQNNGSTVYGDQLAELLSSEGATFETSDLQANTSYVFGIYAVNDEYVSSAEYVTFTTDMLPQIGGETRTNMPGHYTASTTDVNGNIVTFPVTISTGVDDATTAEYSAANRLVALGFGPESDFPYQSPSDLIAAGKSAQEAATLYGPKWFIEFREDGIVVPKPESLNWTMGNFGTSANSYFWGVGIRPSTGRDIDNLYDFPVEVSADGNTVTVKGYYNPNISAYYYPSMCTANSAWWYSDVQFRCYSDLVLERNASASAYLHRGKINAPKTIVTRSFDHSAKEARSKAADRIKLK